jgi:hypothetical protein
MQKRDSACDDCDTERLLLIRFLSEVEEVLLIFVVSDRYGF